MKIISPAFLQKRSAPIPEVIISVHGHNISLLNGAKLFFCLTDSSTGRHLLFSQDEDGWMYVGLTGISDGAWPLRQDRHGRFGFCSKILAGYIRKTYVTDANHFRLQVALVPTMLDGRSMYRLTPVSADPANTSL